MTKEKVFNDENSSEIVIGIFIYVNPETRQVTADLLRAARGALSPDEKDKILQNRINKPLEGA